MRMFEEFKEDLAYYVDKTLKDLSKELKKWFNKGMLSAEDDVQPLYFETMNSGLNPYTKVTFEASGYRYDAFFLIVTEELLDLEDMAQTEDLSLNINIKVFDEESELIVQKSEETTLGEFNEDVFLSYLSDVRGELDDLEIEEE